MRRFIEILALLFVVLLSFNSENSTGGAISQDVINQTFTELTESSANYTMMVALTGRQSNTTPSSRVSSQNKHHRVYITSEIIYNNAVHALCCAFNFFVDDNIIINRLDGVVLLLLFATFIYISFVRDRKKGITSAVEEEILRIENNDAEYHSSVYYIDIISEIERMGDFIINISEALQRK